MKSEMTSDISAEVVVDSVQLDKCQGAWNILSRQDSVCHITFKKYCEMISGGDVSGLRLVVLREQGDIVALAPFVLRKTRKSYTLGERRLFNLPVTILQPAGAGFLGELNQTHIYHIFKSLEKFNDVDLIALGEVKLNGPFLPALEGGLNNTAWKCVRAGHKTSLHWLIDFPATFDDYMGGFSGKTRSTLRRKVRKFDNQLEGTFQVVSRADEVDEFLAVGEKISRSSYQWNVGQRLNDDEPTRQAFTELARNGSLRCYLLFAKGEPCAFMRGTINNGVYHYDTPGFDPQYEKFSPGTVLLLKAVEDLIGHTDCKVFDFGTGGDTTGYKKTFGNKFYETITLEIGRTWRPYTILLFGIQANLSRLKRLANLVLSNDLKRFIKQRIRKYGT